MKEVDDDGEEEVKKVNGKGKGKGKSSKKPEEKEEMMDEDEENQSPGRCFWCDFTIRRLNIRNGSLTTSCAWIG